VDTRGHGKPERHYTELLKVRVDPELLRAIREKANSLNMDLSTFVRWCIQTGLILSDLNAFLRSKMDKGG